jgi:hypothetical protein
VTSNPATQVRAPASRGKQHPACDSPGISIDGHREQVGLSVADLDAHGRVYRNARGDTDLMRLGAGCSASAQTHVDRRDARCAPSLARSLQSASPSTTAFLRVRSGAR